MSLFVPAKGICTRTNYTITSTAQKIVSNNRNRNSLIIQNQGSGTVFLGDQDVTTGGATRGYALFAGATFTDNASDTEWYAVGTGSDIVHVIEV